MADSAVLHAALRDLFTGPDCPEVIIETGTHRGTGSTRILAECAEEVGANLIIETIESQHRWYAEAVANLARFSNVTCNFGSSLARDSILPFLHSDPMLQNHQDYAGVYIDKLATGPELAEWYGAEALGQEEIVGYQDNLLPGLIDTHAGRRLMFLLDSAGGMGWLEFKFLIGRLQGSKFILLADDRHHIKHVRSSNWATAHPEEFSGISGEESWFLAKCRPTTLIEF